MNKQQSFIIFLAIGFLVSALAATNGSAAGMLRVNIFGDDDPLNGVEDSRQPHALQTPNAGTVHCDGKLRGSAMVLDTRHIRDDLNGVVIISAAHVLYDLDQKQRFRRCEFHFLGLGEIRQYRVKIDIRASRVGDFDPKIAIDTPGFGRGDWALLYIRKPWKAFRPEQVIPLADYALLNSVEFKQAGGQIHLVAWDDKAGVISVSRDCRVFESRSDDLGGGAWTGQLLDDCDSGGGASGGGIVAVFNGQQHLVGIRSGSHWSEDAYPRDRFPGGPPQGALWGRSTNTNFARAIDALILAELNDFLHEMADKEQRF